MTTTPKTILIKGEHSLLILDPERYWKEVAPMMAGSATTVHIAGLVNYKEYRCLDSFLVPASSSEKFSLADKMRGCRAAKGGQSLHPQFVGYILVYKGQILPGVCMGSSAPYVSL